MLVHLFYRILFFCHVSAMTNPVINLKRDPSEKQHRKFDNSRLGLIESVHER